MRILFTIAVVIAHATVLNAQALVQSGVRRAAAVGDARDPYEAPHSKVGPSVPRDVWVVLASAVVPGSGQALLGVSRAIPYVALEAWSWTRYLSHASEARSNRVGYRDLAAQVARAAFSARFPVGDFDYYERMEKFAESGAFNLSSTDDLVPESDSTTYNGFVWLLARRTYWKDPANAPPRTSDEWKRAQQFYVKRAYTSEFRWSWKASGLEYGEYRQLIRQSNSENRLALQHLGLLIANHVLSMVDAYVVVRVRAGSGGSTAGSKDLWLEGSIPWTRLGAPRALSRPALGSRQW